MMMTKTTMRSVRSYCRWCCLVVCGDDFKYLQTRGPERERKMWLKNGGKKIFDLYVFLAKWLLFSISIIKIKTLLSLFVSGWTVV
jgi:hypothetical protein